MADVSILKIGSDSYNIKDADARARIASLESYTDYLGVTTTALTDGAETNPITINGEQVTAVVGNIVNYGSAEFIFNGTVWQLFGDLSGLGELAFEDSAEGSYTPAGTVSKPTITVTPATSSIVGVTTTNTPSAMAYDSTTETITFTAGSAAVLSTAVDAMTSATAALDADPTFSGTAATITVAPATP